MCIRSSKNLVLEKESEEEGGPGIVGGVGPRPGEPLALALWRGWQPEGGVGAGRGEVSGASSADPPPSLSGTVTNRDPGLPLGTNTTGHGKRKKFDKKYDCR